jgi:hypothetical protein
LLVVSQGNLGGAGGFHTGMLKGDELGFDWFWCMDDDCVVDEKAFAALTPYLSQTDSIFGSIAISETDPGKLAWFTKLNINGQWMDSNSLKHLTEEKVETTSIPFLGFCIHRSLLAHVGLPLKEMFIWGDDAEMCMRARTKHNVKLFYIPASKIYHPQTIYTPIKALGLQMMAVQASSMKRLYEYRNNAFLLKEHSSSPAFYLKHLPKLLVRLLLQNLCIDKQTSIEGWSKQLKAIKQGVQGQLGKM